MDPLELTGLSPLMAHTSGIAAVVIGLIDGPVSATHPDLIGEHLRFIPHRSRGCNDHDSMACRHGTFIAGILKARRESRAPAICPGCTLLVRAVFSEAEPGTREVPAATPVELASAIIDCADQGARVVNLSIELEEPSFEGDRKLAEALDYCEQKEVLVVAAAGNQGIIGGTVLTRHPWVIPVAACDLRGRPVAYSKVTGSICRNGLRAPGEKVASLGSDGPPVRLGGTSTATPFVTGAIALLWSEFPDADAAEIKSSITVVPMQQQRSVVPPLLNAWNAYQVMARNDKGNTEDSRNKAA